jgi:hypothetical protein
MTTDDDRMALRAVELRQRVEERLSGGERFLSATWVARVVGQRSSGEVIAAKLDPRHFFDGAVYEIVTGLPAGAAPGEDWYTDTRRGAVAGDDASLAVALDRHVGSEPVPTVLAATSSRVLLLRKPAPVEPTPDRVARPGALRQLVGGLVDIVRNTQPAPRPIPPLELVWEVPRAAVVGAEVLDGMVASKLRVFFADDSWVIFIAPVTPYARELADVLAVPPR